MKGISGVYEHDSHSMVPQRFSFTSMPQVSLKVKLVHQFPCHNVRTAFVALHQRKLPRLRSPHAHMCITKGAI
jgi:hypothetical protein